jgi:AraC family transcriptional regulator, regulatory protein of adaptative response / methylated-DNA-[protein]-cysteine methyltransferase
MVSTTWTRDERERRRHGETIHFAIDECPLGAILVATTAKGVSAILLGDEPDGLLQDLRDRFPLASLIYDRDAPQPMIAAILALIERPARGIDLPLDLRGTDFQRRVWQALREIPAGTTTSYRKIAERIGAPNSVRAVARACSANPLAVAIPCHRVTRSDGTLSGYRWGAARKRKLLDREAA